MYELFLAVHSLLRWVVIALGLLASWRAVSGWTMRKAWTRVDERAGRLFAVSLDLQALAGFILYFLLSPITTAAFDNFAAAMSVGLTRFWTVEHIIIMIAALTLGHVGRARVRKAEDPARKHRRAALFFGIGVALLVLGIPWPFSPYARPLFRLG